MKQLAIAGALALALGIAVGEYGGIEWFIVPAIPVVIVAALLRTSRIRAALISAGVGFATVLTYIVAFYVISVGVEDRAANPHCDELCYTRTEVWTLLVFTASVVAAGFAFMSGLLAFFFVKPNERAVTPR